MGHYTIDRAAVASLPGLPSIDGKMRGCAGQILSESQALAPVDTGELVNSGYSSGKASEYRIGYTAEHAPYVEFGTGAHEIEGDPLAFVVGGRAIVTDEVMHPGTDAEPFLTPAATRWRGTL